MRTFNISFFGHRTIDYMYYPLIDNELDNIIEQVFSQNDFVCFNLSQYGIFDFKSISAAKRAKRKFGEERCCLNLILPYMKAGLWRNKRENGYGEYDDFDAVEICAESEIAYYKAAIPICNRYIVDQSDLVICFVARKSGGAYTAVKYAIKKNVQVINLANIIDLD